MTREQMIDEAVKRSIARVTMRGVLCRSIHWVAARKAGEAWTGGPGWFEEDMPFYFYPRRLKAIRAEFRRLSEAAY